jgi:hypothetical protein
MIPGRCIRQDTATSVPGEITSWHAGFILLTELRPLTRGGSLGER